MQKFSHYTDHWEIFSKIRANASDTVTDIVSANRMNMKFLLKKKIRFWCFTFALTVVG